MAETIAYLDCHSGISGDMLLGSFLDAGLPLETLRAELRKLPVEGYEIIHEPFSDYGIGGSRADVRLAQQEQPTRGFRDIVSLLQASTFTERVKERAIAVFRALGEAEARVHGVTLDEIHFHEVGAVDAIVDIVGSVVALELMGIQRLYASPLPLTRGHVWMAHGLIPVPAPATLEILSQVKAPWVPCQLEGELVTPTGAALLATLATFEMPAIRIEKIGYGFGQKRVIWPNCLRVFVGSAYEQMGKRMRGKHGHEHEHEHEHGHDHTHGHDHGHEHEHHVHV